MGVGTFLKESPKFAIEAMLRAGQWQEWRYHSQCPPSMLREAAICWCASSYWRRHEPRLEDWIQIVRDLGDQIKEGDLDRMTDHDIRSLPFPPITWFEPEQYADLERWRRSKTTVESPDTSETPAIGAPQQLRREDERPMDDLKPRRERLSSGLDASAPLPNALVSDSSQFPSGKVAVQPEDSVVVPVDLRAREIGARPLQSPQTHSRVPAHTKVMVWILVAAVIGFLLGLMWKR